VKSGIECWRSLMLPDHCGSGLLHPGIMTLRYPVSPFTQAGENTARSIPFSPPSS
jgi:hypothetical protein